MPNIAVHMYKVAAVADIINDHFKPLIDKKTIIDACLLHDIGKIVDIDSNKFPEFVEPDRHDLKARRATDKRISPARVLAETGFEFEFPDYRSGLINALAK